MQQPTIIYETESFLAVEKPSGMLVHPAGAANSKGQIANSRERTLVGWLLGRYPEIKNVGDDPETRPGIVHRLDRATSGILLVAKTQEAFDYLKSLFKNREIQKTYLALVWGVPDKKEGEVEKAISLKPGTTRRTVYEGKETRLAKTSYRAIATLSPDRIQELTGDNPEGEPGTLLEVRPLTGRTHQIRVHLASIGHPVVGDRKYGRKWERSRSKKQKTRKTIEQFNSRAISDRMYLHAFSLEFINRDGAKLHLATDIPWWAVNHSNTKEIEQ